MRKPDYWEAQEIQEQYAAWLESQPSKEDQQRITRLKAAVEKARGDSPEEIAASINFLNKASAFLLKKGNEDGR